MLACNQIHDLQVKCGRHVAHPICLRYVGAIQVVILIVLKDLQGLNKMEGVLETLAQFFLYMNRD